MLLVLALAIVLSAAQVSQQCINDMQGVLNQTIVVGGAIANAAHVCGGGNSPACNNAVEAVNEAVGNLTLGVQSLAKDCFNAGSPQCVQRIDAVLLDLKAVGSDSAQAAKDCGPNGSNPACTVDLEGISADLFRAGIDISAAVTICSSAPLRRPLLLRQVQK
jgi:hypothetical protein